MSREHGKYWGRQQFLLVYTELITAARYRGTITYQEIAAILGIYKAGNHMAREVGLMLGEIVESEVRNGQPMLSAIAVSSNGKPSDGFYILAHNLGLLSEDTPEARKRFLDDQQRAVYDTWKKEPKA